MKTRSFRGALVCMILVAIIASPAGAQNADDSQRQEELQEALELMKAQGMDEKSMQQFEAMMQGMIKSEGEARSASSHQQQTEFDARWAGNGDAQVEIDGERYLLKVTTCYLAGLQEYQIEALQPPGSGTGRLWVAGKKQYYSADEYRPTSEFGFSTPAGSYRPVVDAGLEFDGQRISWAGRVAAPDGSPARLKFDLQLPCEER